MVIAFKTINLRTKAYCDVIDITNEVQNSINGSGIKNGVVNVHVPGSTGAISTTECEPGLVKRDIEELLEKIIPYDKEYAHHKTWNDHNGAGHLRSFLLKTSQTFPFKNGKLMLGTWQQIVFLEFDEKGRSREIICTILGE
jgi:secondary thiamine-phosphate synthase enzyme